MSNTTTAKIFKESQETCDHDGGAAFKFDSRHKTGPITLEYTRCTKCGKYNEKYIRTKPNF